MHARAHSHSSTHLGIRKLLGRQCLQLPEPPRLVEHPLPSLSSRNTRIDFSFAPSLCPFHSPLFPPTPPTLHPSPQSRVRGARQVGRPGLMANVLKNGWLHKRSSSVFPQWQRRLVDLQATARGACELNLPGHVAWAARSALTLSARSRQGRR